MANNNKNGGSTIFAIIGVLLVIALFGSCSGGNSKYDDDLNSGMKKYYSGEKMSEDEYNAVKDYNELKDKNTDKTYDDWDN